MEIWKYTLLKLIFIIENSYPWQFRLIRRTFRQFHRVIQNQILIQIYNFFYKFLCALPFTQFVEILYIWVFEGRISPFKSQCTIGVRCARANPLKNWVLCWGGKQLVWGSKFWHFLFCLKSIFKGLNHIYI